MGKLYSRLFSDEKAEVSASYRDYEYDAQSCHCPGAVNKNR